VQIKRRFLAEPEAADSSSSSIGHIGPWRKFGAFISSHHPSREFALFCAFSSERFPLLLLRDRSSAATVKRGEMQLNPSPPSMNLLGFGLELERKSRQMGGSLTEKPMTLAQPCGVWMTCPHFLVCLFVVPNSILL
jgi:hypothetical protein